MLSIHYCTLILLHFQRLFSLFYNPIYLIKVKYPLNFSYKTDLYNMRMSQIRGENSIIYIKIFIAITLNRWAHRVISFTFCIFIFSYNTYLAVNRITMLAFLIIKHPFCLFIYPLVALILFLIPTFDVRKTR